MDNDDDIDDEDLDLDHVNEYEEDGKRNNKQNWVILLPFMLSKYCIYSIASVSSL